MEFRKENINPKGWKTGDCVVRALAKANNMSWESTYLLLCEIGLKKCRMPNAKHTYEQLLKNYGWGKYKMPRHEDGTRYTVRELVDEYPSCRIVISMANHLTFADKGTLIDSWNCGNKSVGNYWLKDEEETISMEDINNAIRKVL